MSFLSFILKAGLSCAFLAASLYLTEKIGWREQFICKHISFDGLIGKSVPFHYCIYSYIVEQKYFWIYFSCFFSVNCCLNHKSIFMYFWEWRMKITSSNLRETSIASLFPHCPFLKPISSFFFFKDLFSI